MLVVFSAFAWAQKLSVKIIDHQDNETNYSYVVPGYSSSQSNTSVNCSSAGDSVNCGGSTTSNGYSTPPKEVSLHVRGATLSLLLPDGRIAVVNCESKFAEHMAGPQGNHRSCRVPIMENIEADFRGGKARLEWPVSLDGKKIDSETYKVLGIFDKPTSGQR
jgi:hypothetical protein